MFSHSSVPPRWQYAMQKVPKFSWKRSRKELLGQAVLVIIFLIFFPQPDAESNIKALIAASVVTFVLMPYFERGYYLLIAPQALLKLDHARMRRENAQLQRRIDRLTPKHDLRLSFEPGKAPYFESYPGQSAVVAGNGKQTIVGEPWIKQLFRICAHNDGQDSIEDVSVSLTRFDPPLPKFNDVPLHKMHDNDVWEKSFHLNPDDHQFVDLVFKRSTETEFRLYHAVPFLEQKVPAGKYDAILSIKGRGHRARFYRFNVSVDENGDLNVSMQPE